MTLSSDQRHRESLAAISAMLDYLGERDILDTSFYTASPPFNTFPKTTWDDLYQNGIVEPSGGIGRIAYRFTGDGWYKALKRTDRIKHCDFIAHLQQLIARFKAVVKNTREEDIIHLQTLESEGFSGAFVSNVIDGEVIQKQCNMEGPEWVAPRGLYIRVPANYGHRPISI